MAGLTVSSVTGPSKRVREDVVCIENSRALLIPINLLINEFVVENIIAMFDVLFCIIISLRSRVCTLIG